MKARKIIGSTLFYLLVTAIVVYTIFPFYWAIVSSLKEGSALYKVDFLPPKPEWGNYTAIFKEQPFGKNILNSLVVAVSVVAISLALSVTASYKPLTIITKVFLPLLGPAMATAGLLAFIAAWNEFMFAITFTLSNERRTVPVAIALISGASRFELPWGRVMAASVIVTVPLVVLVLIFQRRIVSGLTAGAVKG